MSGYGYLVDTSAIVRLSRDLELRDRWRERADVGALAVCSVTELEILFTARSKAHRNNLVAGLKSTYRWVVMPDRIFGRALDVQEDLTHRGAHRSAGPIDLLVAATAEEHGLTLLHYDSDFLHVADVTGQPVCWLAPPGSID